VERWLGLARIQIQTASGSAKAEMTIEGVENFLEVRDFLYSRMRGAADRSEHGSPPSSGDDSDELAEILRQTATEIREVRVLLEKRGRELDA
jgi:putative membrane protein